MEKFKKYRIPTRLLNYFVKISQETRNPLHKENNIETLGLIVGTLENDVVYAKELYLPYQEATASQVNNLGKYSLKSYEFHVCKHSKLRAE